MNEKDFKAIEDLAELASGDNSGAASIELECRLRLVPAIIARQLTIANEIAHARGVNELRAQSGMSVAYPDEYFDRILGEPDKLTSAPDDAEKFINNLANLLSEDEKTDEEYLEKGMAIVNDWRKRQLAPDDALVEAVKKFLDNELSQQGNIIRRHGTYTRVTIDGLRFALAAHKEGA